MTAAAPRLVALVCVIATSAAIAPAHADAAYGAIGIDPLTLDWGTAHGAATKREAKRRARKACGGGCVIAVWVRDRCGAVVVTPTRYFAGMASTRRAAVRSARRHSHFPGARRLAWICSG